MKTIAVLSTPLFVAYAVVASFVLATLCLLDWYDGQRGESEPLRNQVKAPLKWWWEELTSAQKTSTGSKEEAR